MDFTIDFLGQLDIATVKEVLSSYIFDTTPRVRLGDNVGNIVGNQVIYYDSLLDYMNVQFGTSKYNVCLVYMFRLVDTVGNIHYYIPINDKSLELSVSWPSDTESWINAAVF